MGYSQRRTEQGCLARVWSLSSGTMLGSRLLGWGQGHHSPDGTSVTVLLVVHMDSSLVAQRHRKVGSGSHGLGGWWTGFWIQVGCVVLEAGPVGLEVKVGQTV